MGKRWSIETIERLITEDPCILNEITQRPDVDLDLDLDSKRILIKQAKRQCVELENTNTAINAFAALNRLSAQRKQLDIDNDEWLIALMDSSGFEKLVTEIFSNVGGTFTNLAAKFGMKPLEYIIKKHPTLYHTIMAGGLNSTTTQTQRDAERRDRRMQASRRATTQYTTIGRMPSRSPKGTAVSLESKQQTAKNKS